MENFFLDYRDPIFGIIVFILAGLIIAIFSYLWSVFSKKEEASKIEKFIQKFDLNKGLGTRYQELLKSSDIAIDGLVVLANVFSRSGDFDKAINVYLIALQKDKNSKKDKEFILTELGKIYFSAGFLKKSEQTLLQSIELSPRNEVALKYLSVIYERLKLFDKELEVLDALKEQGIDTTKSEAFTKALIISNDTTLSFDKKIKAISNLNSPQTLRLILELFIKNNEPLSKIKKFPPLSDVIDIIWHLKQSINLKDDEYKALFYAKNLSSEYVKSSFFEIEAISMMRNSGYFGADLNFKYICPSCKSSLPAYFYRCPMCYSLDDTIIIPQLIRRDDEINIPF